MSSLPIRESAFGSSVRKGFGVVAIVSSVWILLFGLPDFDGPNLAYRKHSEIKPGETGYPELHGFFPTEKLVQYRVGADQAGSYMVNVAHYLDEQKHAQRAMVYLSDQSDLTSNLRVSQGNKTRYQAWQAAAKAIKKHTAEDALFAAWWDNSQRIKFLSGRRVWWTRPVAGAFADQHERDFWSQVAGGFSEDDEAALRLAKWFTMDADKALADMASNLPRKTKLYFLVCVDDLMRLAEMGRLSKKSVPFETRLFPAADNIHGLIGQVRTWANETSQGSYLLQQLPGSGVRAWRVSKPGGENTLLARLLPFTHSLTNPLKNPKLVFQSGPDGFLSIYKWTARDS